MYPATYLVGLCMDTPQRLSIAAPWSESSCVSTLLAGGDHGCFRVSHSALSVPTCLCLYPLSFCPCPLSWIPYSPIFFPICNGVEVAEKPGYPGGDMITNKFL